MESAVRRRLSRGARPCVNAPARVARATDTESPAWWDQPSTRPERQSGSGNMLSSAIAASYAAIAESHDARRNHCSPRRNALSAGSEVEPIAVVRKTSIRRVRPSSRSSRTVSESARRSTRSAASRSSRSASGRPSETSSAVAVSRAESRPAPSRLPKTTTPAPVRRPRSVADGRSARPRQRRITVVGGTLRTGPAPSRLRESTSTSPSRQSASRASGTSNGATATRSASSGTAPREWRISEPRRPRPARTEDGDARRREDSAASGADASSAGTADRSAAGRPSRAARPIETPPLAGSRPFTGVVGASSACSTSAALCGRSAGRFSRQRMSSAASAGGTLGRSVRERRRRLEQVRRHHRLRGRRRERRPAGQDLVAQHTERVEVRAVVGVRVRRRLLGRHVGRRAEREAGAGEGRLPRLVERLGDAEVGHQRVPSESSTLSGLMSRCTTPCRWA